MQLGASRGYVSCLCGKVLKGAAIGLVSLQQSVAKMASNDKYESQYSEELTNFIDTPAAAAPAPESTEFGVRSTAVSSYFP